MIPVAMKIINTPSKKWLNAIVAVFKADAEFIK